MQMRSESAEVLELVCKHLGLKHEGQGRIARPEPPIITLEATRAPRTVRKQVIRDLKYLKLKTRMCFFELRRQDCSGPRLVFWG